MRRALALALIVSLSYMPAAQAAGPLLASAIRAVSELDPTGGQTAQQVQLLGVGAEVKVKLAAGDTLDGVIASIGATTFELTLARDRASRAVAYADVAEVRFARTKYRAEGRPDAAEAARVAAGLVGHHVAVKVADRSTYRGHVQQAAADHLVLQLDQAGTPHPIPYADIEAMETNLSRTAKAGLWTTAVVLGLTIILTIMEVKEEPDI